MTEYYPELLASSYAEALADYTADVAPEVMATIIEGIKSYTENK